MARGSPVASFQAWTMATFTRNAFVKLDENSGNSIGMPKFMNWLQIETRRNQYVFCAVRCYKPLEFCACWDVKARQRDACIC